MVRPDKNVIAHSHAQEALARNETLFRALIENSSDIIVLLDAYGKVSYVSPSITRIMGYPSEDFLGCNALDFVHPDDLDGMSGLFQSILQSPRKSLSVEYRLRCHDGSWRWFEGVETNLLDDPEVGAIVGNFRDITERKQAEEQLKANEERFRTLTEKSTDAISLIDREGRRLYSTPTSSCIIGYEPMAYVGEDPFGYIHPEDAQHVRQVLGAIIQQPGKSLPAQFRVQHKNGHWIWIEGTGTNLLDQPGIQAIVVNYRDITERKQLEFAIRQSKQQLEVILQNIADGISVQDAQGNVVYMNEAGARLCGYTSVEEFMRTPDFQTQRTTTLQRYEILDEQGNPFPLTELPGSRALRGENHPHAIVQYFDRVSQHYRWSLIKAQPIFDEQGSENRQVQLAVTVFSDITEAYEDEKRKDEFIGMASHELKTPLTTIKGLTQLVHRRLEKQGATEFVPIVATIETQVNRVNRLVNDFLDISKIRAGRLDYTLEAIDLDELVHAIVDTAQLTSPTHTITVQGASHNHITGDRDRLEQVFFNLINNAVKYSPQAEQVDIHIATAQDTVTVSVQDYGVGIPQEHRSKIFDRFYSVNDDKNKAFPGLGMGLYISYEIVRRHGGDITVTSEEGQGSTFTVSLPLK